MGLQHNLEVREHVRLSSRGVPICRLDSLKPWLAGSPIYEGLTNKALWTLSKNFRPKRLYSKYHMFDLVRLETNSRQ